MELTEEQKYARKAALLKTALAEADKMDAADAKKTAPAKAKKKADNKEQKDQMETERQAGAAPVMPGS